MRSTGLLHHLELWVPDLARAERSWGWLLTRLGAEPYRSRDGVLRPFAGGPEHRAAHLADADGYEVELVAGSGRTSRTVTGPGPTD